MNFRPFEHHGRTARVGDMAHWRRIEKELRRLGAAEEPVPAGMIEQIMRRVHDEQSAKPADRHVLKPADRHVLMKPADRHELPPAPP